MAFVSWSSDWYSVLVPAMMYTISYHIGARSNSPRLHYKLSSHHQWYLRIFHSYDDKQIQHRILKIFKCISPFVWLWVFWLDNNKLLKALFLKNFINHQLLTHWGRVTHIYASRLTLTGSDNGLSSGRRQAITWTNAVILLIGPWGTNVSENLIEILTFSFTKMRLKVSSAKWQPFCLDLTVLKEITLVHRSLVQQ